MIHPGDEQIIQQILHVTKRLSEMFLEPGTRLTSDKLSPGDMRGRRRELADEFVAVEPEHLRLWHVSERVKIKQVAGRTVGFVARDVAALM